MKADAYSLGALIYDYFYKDTLYDTRIYTSCDEVRQLHRTGGIALLSYSSICMGLAAH